MESEIECHLGFPRCSNCVSSCKLNPIISELLYSTKGEFRSNSVDTKMLKKAISTEYSVTFVRDLS